MSRTVHFLSNDAPMARAAFDIAQAARPDIRWRRFVGTGDGGDAFEAEATRHLPDVVVSFLNPHIVSAALLDRLAGCAFNVHPATPDYPGQDPEHHAAYAGDWRAGATLHRMIAAVDAGEILDVIEAPVERALGIRRMGEVSAHMALSVFLRNLDGLADGTITAKGAWRWRDDSKRSRADFITLSKLSPALSPQEIDRRIEAFHNPTYRNRMHVEVGGRYFVFDEDFDRMKREEKP